MTARRAGSPEAALAADLVKMMNAWERIEAATRRAFSHATAEERYRISSAAMRHALKLEPSANA